MPGASSKAVWKPHGVPSTNDKQIQAKKNPFHPFHILERTEGK